MQTQIDDKLETLANVIYASAEAEDAGTARTLALEEHDQMQRIKQYVLTLEEGYDNIEDLKQDIWG